MKARKEAMIISMDRDGVEGSDDAQAAVEEYMGRTTPTHTRLSKKLFSPAQAPLQYDYEEKNTAAYVAARMPAVYGAVYRVLSEVWLLIMVAAFLPFSRWFWGWFEDVNY